MKIELKQTYSFIQLGKRTNQEDARFPDSDTPKGVQPAFVVCDGVGGMDNGEIASRCVSESLGTYMEHVDLNKPFGPSEFGKALSHVFVSLEKAMSGAPHNMATTLTFLCFSASGAFCAHIGDSRIYHIRPGSGILYRSEDHSLVNALVHSGNLTPEEAIGHPQSNVITRCLGYVEKGYAKPAATSILISDVEGGDYFFLCSDGVLHDITDEELVEILSATSVDDQQKIKRIAEICQNSSDNNTAFLIPVKDVTEKKKDTEVRQHPDNSTVKLTEHTDCIVEVHPHEEPKSSLNKLFGKLTGFLKG